MTQSISGLFVLQTLPRNPCALQLQDGSSALEKAEHRCRRRFLPLGPSSRSGVVISLLCCPSRPRCLEGFSTRCRRSIYLKIPLHWVEGEESWEIWFPSQESRVEGESLSRSWGCKKNLYRGGAETSVSPERFLLSPCIAEWAHVVSECCCV